MDAPETHVPEIYRAIVNISGELAKSGIAKNQRNLQQGYAFRGIDAIYNALAPLLAQYRVAVIPRVLSRTVTERGTRGGGVLFSVVVEAEFDFVSAADGSRATVRMVGEAMDSGDKATNKAMSAAYKYAALQTFCIPTEGDNDADTTTHEVLAPAPEGFEDWLIDLDLVATEQGIGPLQATWKASPPMLRKYLTDTNKAEWEAIKARAAQRDATKDAR